ncbi:MAG: MFS transporter [Alphaproteobacteria bacterium]|nr:MFS transporter [Alphaproteobacteria bacterium]
MTPPATPQAPEVGSAPAGPPEMPLYLWLVGLYFFAFGLQFALYPSLVTFILKASPLEVGWAQMAISAPMAVFLIWGGVLADRVRAGPALAALQVCFALPAFGLAAALAAGIASYPLVIVYALCMGTAAAFMLPVRDAALNGVVARDAARGKTITIGSAAAAVTAVQIGAQILGILAAQNAGAAPAPYFVLLGVSVLLAAGVALRLRAPSPPAQGTSLASALRDIQDGFAYALKSPVMGPMLWSAAYVGVFVIGSFQVLFPIIIRDAYGGTPAQQSELLAVLFAIFWCASFVSAALLSRLPPVGRPGMALIVSHMIGGMALVSFAANKPFWIFGVIVGVWGLASGVAISMSRTITQSAASPTFLGRVLAIYSLGFFGGAPIGSAITGLAADLWGPQTAALIPGLGIIAAALVLAMASPIWRIDAQLQTRR